MSRFFKRAQVLLNEDAEIFRNRIKANAVFVRGEVIGRMMFYSSLGYLQAESIQPFLNERMKVIKTGCKPIL